MGYLTISRKLNERIMLVGPNNVKIEILISDIRFEKDKNERVDISIDAPKEFDIQRCQTHMREHDDAFRNKFRPRHKTD